MRDQLFRISPSNTGTIGQVLHGSVCPAVPVSVIRSPVPKRVAHGAESVAEIVAIEQANSLRREHSLAREHQHEAAAKAKKAERASGNLFNAVRRGDIKAVQTLLDIRADPTITTPNGTTLSAYALSVGRIDIANLLANIADTKISCASPRITALGNETEWLLVADRVSRGLCP